MTVTNLISFPAARVVHSGQTYTTPASVLQFDEFGLS